MGFAEPERAICLAPRLQVFGKAFEALGGYGESADADEVPQAQGARGRKGSHETDRPLAAGSPVGGGEARESLGEGGSIRPPLESDGELAETDAKRPESASFAATEMRQVGLDRAAIHGAAALEQAIGDPSRQAFQIA